MSRGNQLFVGENKKSVGVLCRNFEKVDNKTVVDFIEKYGEPTRNLVVKNTGNAGRGFDGNASEISFFGDLREFEITIKDGNYIAEPNLWIGKRSLYPRDATKIPESVSDDDYLLVSRVKGEPSVDRIVLEGSSPVWVIDPSGLDDLVRSIQKLGYIQLEPKIIDPNEAKTINGDFVKVDEISFSRAVYSDERRGSREPEPRGKLSEARAESPRQRRRVRRSRRPRRKLESPKNGNTSSQFSPEVATIVSPETPETRQIPSCDPVEQITFIS